MGKSYYATKLNAENLRRVYEIAEPKVCQYLQAEIDHLAGLVRPGEKILELGCGYGRVLAPLARIVGQGWGVDNSLENVELAMDEHPDLNWSVMDAGSLAIDDHIFDIVFGVQNFISACKVPPEKLLRECLRVARPGGRVLLSSYTEEFWPHRLKWFRRQAAEGLLGPIDEEATGNGVIICTDGFKATTFSQKEFWDLTMCCGVSAKVFTVDDSSVFCEIEVSGSKMLKKCSDRRNHVYLKGGIKC